MKKICFVIMPIGEYDSLVYEHYLEVYEDLFVPAIRAAGFEPKRADEETACNVIQCDIIDNIINADMALCDLSGKNPNVLYELGIRQAFDLPVVLVQEQGTSRIFDINIIRTIDYDKNMNNRRLKKDMESITNAIKKTSNSNNGINSVIKFLNIEKRLTEKEISDKESVDVLLNVLLDKVRDIENGQDGIYELIYSNKTNEEMSYNTIQYKWNDFIDSYIKISKKLTQLEFWSIEESQYDTCLENIEDILYEIGCRQFPCVYANDLILRSCTLRNIIKLIKTIKVDKNN